MPLASDWSDRSRSGPPSARSTTGTRSGLLTSARNRGNRSSPARGWGRASVGVVVAEWHLEEVRSALERRGWTIVEHPGDDYRIASTWELRRGGDDRIVHVDFEGLDDMRTLSIVESYGCRVREGTEEASKLYFRRRRSRELWEAELAAFVLSIEPKSCAPT